MLGEGLDWGWIGCSCFSVENVYFAVLWQDLSRGARDTIEAETHEGRAQIGHSGLWWVDRGLFWAGEHWRERRGQKGGSRSSRCMCGVGPGGYGAWSRVLESGYGLGLGLQVCD